MHGKILRYSNQTKNGVIVNASKKIFELRGSSWHDPKMMPSTGMLVEFRLDDNGYAITDCKASKYQTFPEDGLIREIDFWRTNTDDELKSKEADARANIAKQIFTETNYLKLNVIELSKQIPDTIKDYFRDEFQSLMMMGQMIAPEEQQDSALRVNYIIVKTYLNKAVDFLVFNDRHITIDNFADDLQMLKQLEYSYKRFQTNVNLTPDKIYEECFLDVQYHYKGVLRAIDSFSEKKLALQNKIRVGSMEIRSIQNKIDGKRGDLAVLEEKKVKTRALISKAESDIKIVESTIGRLKALSNNFKKDNLAKFEVVFNKMYEMLINKTKDAMDIVATHIDNKLWKLGMGSVAIKNVFFKHDINSAFCVMTFLGNHVKMLDKSKLRDNEYAVYQYYNKYINKNAKHYLIFTDEQNFALELKIKIMSASKTNVVTIYHKEIEYFSAVNSKKFEVIYINSELKLHMPSSIIKIGKESKKNKDSNFALVSLSQIKTLEI